MLTPVCKRMMLLAQEAKAKLPQGDPKLTASRQRKTGVKATMVSRKRKAADEADDDDTKGDTANEARLHAIAAPTHCAV